MKTTNPTTDAKKIFNTDKTKLEDTSVGHVQGLSIKPPETIQEVRDLVASAMDLLSEKHLKRIIDYDKYERHYDEIREIWEKFSGIKDDAVVTLPEVKQLVKKYVELHDLGLTKR